MKKTLLNIVFCFFVLGALSYVVVKRVCSETATTKIIQTLVASGCVEIVEGPIDPGLISFGQRYVEVGPYKYEKSLGLSFFDICVKSQWKLVLRHGQERKFARKYLENFCKNTS